MTTVTLDTVTGADTAESAGGRRVDDGIELKQLARNLETAGALEVAFQAGRYTMYRALKEGGKLKEPGGKLGRRIRRSPYYSG